MFRRRRRHKRCYFDLDVRDLMESVGFYIHPEKISLDVLRSGSYCWQSTSKMTIAVEVDCLSYAFSSRFGYRRVAAFYVVPTYCEQSASIVRIESWMFVNTQIPCPRIVMNLRANKVNGEWIINIKRLAQNQLQLYNI